jgi:hypothetical protein
MAADEYLLLTTSEYVDVELLCQLTVGEGSEHDAHIGHV